MNALEVSNRPKVRKFVPTPEQAVAMESSECSCNWFWQRPPDELAKYVNQSVAVYECEIVAVAPTLEELIPKITSLDRSRLYVVSFPLRSRIRVCRP